MALRLSFRQVQIGILILVLVTTFAVVGVSTSVTTRLAVMDLSSQVLLQTSERIDLEVRGLVEVAVAQGRIVEELLESGEIPVDDMPGMEAYFLEVMRVEDRLSYLSYSTEGGDYWHVARKHTGALGILERRMGPDGRRDARDYAISQDGTRQETFHDMDASYDPRLRPFYVRAREVGHATWTDTYVFVDEAGQPDVTGVTRAVPIERGGALVGVLTVDVDLVALGKFLSALPVGRTGYAFMLEERADGTRRVVAHPDPGKLLRSTPGQPDLVEAIPVDAIDDVLVRGMAGQIPPDISAFGGAIVPVRFEVDGREYLGAYKHLGGSEAPPWIVCAVLPEDDSAGGLLALARTALGLAGAGILLAVTLGLVTARVLSRTIVDLEEELLRVAQFELSGVRFADSPSLVAELDDMRVAIDAMKSGLRSFEHYVPTGLVRQLVLSGVEAKLGASRRELTILFAEVSGFADLVESADPKRLMEALGDYLHGMNGAIASTDGTVCQYLGDVVMAFWGAPADQSDHAVRACRGALAMRENATRLASEAKIRRVPALPTHFGLCTGNVLVGNIGAPNRFNYGALGDAVNTAARITGLNKTYGTSLLISPATAAQVGPELVTRAVDWVRMKGKVKPLLVHELVGIPGEVAPNVLQGLERYALGLAAYRERRFDVALEAFRSAQEAFGKDGPSRVMIERCTYFTVEPPPADWDGVFVMKTK